MPFLTQAVVGGPGWPIIIVMLGAAACYIFLALLPFYYENRGAAREPDPKRANLLTASLILLLVGIFLAAFSISVRLTYGWAAASILGLESAAYFLVATAALVAARRRAGRPKEA